MLLSTYYYCNAYLLLHIAASARADTIWSFLPTCAQSCAEEGANAVSNCDSTDYGCYCASAEFHQVSTCCVRASCDSYDAELVYSESRAFCADYGVSVTSLAATACSTTYGAGPVATATFSALNPSVTTGGGDTGITTALGTADAAGSTITGSAATVTTTVSVAGGYIATVTYTYPAAAAATDSSSSGSSSSSSGSSGGSSTSGLTSKTKKGRLSNGAKIGIGVGAGVGGLLLIGLVAFGIYKCVTRGRRHQDAVAVAAGKDNENGDGSSNGGEMYNNKSEMDGSQQLQQQQQVQQEQQQPQQQQNQPPPGHDGSATATSLVSSSLTGPSELQTIQQGYYQHPDNDAQELAAQYQYHEQQQQEQVQHSGWNAAQAEMSVSHEHLRNEIQ